MVGVAVATPTLPSPYQLFVRLALLATPTTHPKHGKPYSCHTNFGRSAPPMVLGVIGSDEQKCPTIFVDTDEKINRVVDEGLLDRIVILWVKMTYPEGNFTFHQDVAPGHNIAVVQAKLTEELGGLLSNPTSTRPITACRASCRMVFRLPLIPTLSR